MDFQCVRYEVKGKVALVKFHRPHVLNAMNRQLWEEFQQALVSAREDNGVSVLVITGEGRAFSTGADLKESKQRSPEEYRDYLVHLQEITRQLLRFPKPVIAAINGYALGSGYEVALACDIRIAAEDAKIGSPEAKVSSSVTGGAFRLLQELVGPGKARELLFTADFIDGREAERIGLVNLAVPSERLLETALDMAQRIAQNSLFSLQIIKRGLNLARDAVSLEALMDFEVEGCMAAVFTEERRRRLEDFERRKGDS
jgi:enoyl-CoA hydratase